MCPNSCGVKIKRTWQYLFKSRFFNVFESTYTILPLTYCDQISGYQLSLVLRNFIMFYNILFSRLITNNYNSVPECPDKKISQNWKFMPKLVASNRSELELIIRRWMPRTLILNEETHYLKQPHYLKHPPCHAWDFSQIRHFKSFWINASIRRWLPCKWFFWKR